MERSEYLVVCRNARELMFIHRLLGNVLHAAGDDIYVFNKTFLFDRTQKANIRFVTWSNLEQARCGFRGKEINGYWLERQIDLGLIHSFSDIDICIKKANEQAKEYLKKE